MCEINYLNLKFDTKKKVKQRNKTNLLFEFGI
jgi:hypothetical protein